jgi:RimJ/RimL family protein N-acetyltransferase
MKNITIPTNRFLLRSLTESNVDKRYFNWINSSEKSQYIDYSSQDRSIEEVRDYVSQRIGDNSILFLGIFLRESNEHIGNIKFEPINFDNKTAVMGILIGEKDWRGVGVASEVIKSSSEWLNKQYDINHIALGVDSKNIAAIKAYKKIGFKNKQTPCITITHKSQLTMAFDFL